MAFQTGVVRALLSVPGHFLFGVLMGHFLSLAKFHPVKNVATYILNWSITRHDLPTGCLTGC
jgi:hypothetical protein